MADLMKVSVALRNVDRSLDPEWRTGLCVWCGLIMSVALLATPLLAAAAFVGFLFTCVSAFGMLITASPRRFLPPSARTFLRETQVERRELVRRTEAHNRAWCLAERSGTITPERARELYGTSYKKIAADVRAYAERYRAAVAADLLSVEARNGRKLLRQTVADRSRDLRELEARLNELGTDAGPEARAQARMMRESLERDRLALREPFVLPSAKVVTH